MIVSTKDLLTALSQYCPIISGNHGVIQFTTVGNDTKPASDRLYILSAQEINAFPDRSQAAAFICCQDAYALDPACLSPAARVPTVILRVSAPYDAVLKCVQSVREQPYESVWMQNKVLLMAMQQKNLNDLLRAAMHELNLPFSVFDRSAHLIAHSYHGDVCVKDQQKKDLVDRFSTREHRDMLINMGAQEQLYRQNQVSRVQLPNEEELICASIYVDDDFYGILFSYDILRPFAAADTEVVRVLADVISLLLKNEYEDYSIYKTKEICLLHNLLTSELEPQSAEAQVLQMNMKFPQEMCLLVVGSCGEAVADGLHFRRYSSLLEKLFPRPGDFLGDIHESHIVFLLDAAKYRQQKKKLTSGLHELLTACKMYASIGNVFSGLANVKMQYELAKRTIQIGTELAPDKNLYLFSDYLGEHVIKLCGQVVSLDSFRHPVFDMLEEYDRVYDTDYVTTLFHYLRSGGNMTQCAMSLGIHYNTVKYRLKSIKQITNTCVNEPDVFFSLLVSMKAIEENNRVPTA